MTALADSLVRRIAAEGPITLADYMSACLLDPTHGYYTTRAPFGAGGDFTTAPEISQLFGEMIGVALARAWIDHGRPAPITLAEPGPGRGTLMADILRATRAVPGFHDAVRIVLLEASPHLREQQRQTLAGHAVHWIDSVDALPEAPLFLIANEFFDALPIRQFVASAEGWHERMVTLNAAGGLAFALSPVVPAGLAGLPARAAEGEVIERRPAADPVMAAIGARLAAHGGLALIVDYGAWQGKGDSFQAVRGHGYADPLAAPGKADLTAHVDFAALARAAAPARAWPLATQGAFLERLGITARAQALAARPGAGESTASQHRRLTHPQEMGHLFKALALTGPAAPLPPGIVP